MDNKKQRKILQIITKSNFGGAQKYVLELSQQIKKNDFEVVVAFGGHGILEEKLRAVGIRTISIENLGREINFIDDIKVFWQLIKIIRSEKPDVVHLNSSKIGAIGALAARICFVPKIIFTIHGLAFNENRGLFSKTLIKKIYWLTIFLSHQSIAISKYVRDELVDNIFFKLLKNKIVIIKNAVDEINFLNKQDAENFIQEKINEISRKNNFAEPVSLNSKFIIGTIAELHHVKGLNFLIESAKKITDKNHDVLFVVMGDGDEKENLQTQINSLGLQEKFFLTGFVDEASKYMKAFNLFVLPSLSEGLALVLLEAKQANLPIVASRVGGIPEALTGYDNSILCKAKNIDDLQTKIEIMYEKNKLNKNSDEFRKYEFKDEFQSTTEQTMDLYRF
jgi:glycosyltransferase involved in cell wall biosynthesis